MNKKVILISICILCLGFILFNSSQISSVSNTRSRKVVSEVTNIISKTDIGQSVLKRVDNTEFNLIIRKIAHWFEFFLLGAVISFTLRYFNIDDKNVLIYTLFIVLFSAVMDEFFQIFIQERNSSVVDVLIDFGGGIIADMVFLIFSKPIGKHYRKYALK